MGGNPERFAREELLVGSEGIERLASSHVAVFGIGGVGSFCAEALVRAGIGEITFVDSDVVQASNSNRQLVALTSTLGRPKVDVMAERALDINPDLKVHAVKAWFAPDNADQILSAGFDYVADAIDSVESKLALISKCHEKGIRIASSMGAGNKLDAIGFRIADISATHTCPLAKAIRTRLKREGITNGITVVFSETEPVRRAPGPPGSISFVPPVAGLFLAQVVIRGLLEIKAESES
jgi:tRNA A37 threonylcarbamoyladenosine dehydratase